MKLAEALSLRADLQNRIAQLSERLNLNAKVQQDDLPAEQPELLLAELDRTVAELEQLITRINRTNCLTTVGDTTITGLLARRDALSLKNKTLRSFLAEASAKVARYTNTEIRITSTVNVAELQKQVDGISRELREIDTAVQGCNWTTELM